MKINGKISQFLKNNWRALLFAFSLLVGIFCGYWTCSKSATVSIDAYRPRIVVKQSPTNNK